MRFFFSNRRGFTLLELTIYGAVASILLTAMLHFAWSIIGLGAKVAVGTETIENAYLAMERITQKMSLAHDIEDEDTSGNQHDDSLTDFSAGTHNKTQWDDVNLWLELTTPGISTGAGDFTSRVMTASSPLSWGPFGWTPQQPYGKELPGNAQKETAYPSYNADMTGNTLLLHLNETNGPLLDASGQNNHGLNHGATTGVAGRYSTALGFTGSPPASLLQLNPAADSWIMEGYNYLNYGTNPSLWVYYPFWLFNFAHGLIRFDLSAIPPNAPITSAILRLHQSLTLGSTRDVGAYRITNSWTEGTSQNYSGVTWSTRNGSTLWTAPGGDYITPPSAQTPVSWDPYNPNRDFDWNLTGDVQAFVNGTYPNYGWLLRPVGGGAPWFITIFHARENYTSRPQLTINYGQGSGPYADVNHHSSLMPVQLSAEAWINLNSLPTANQWYGILSKGDEFTNDGYELYVRASNAGSGANRLAFGIGSTMVYANNIPATGKWIHVAGTFDGTTMRLYVNGELQNSAPATLTANTGSLYIGRRTSNASHAFDGTIDEIAIYNRPLAASELVARYQRGALNVRFQVRNGATNPPTGSFVGPDGTTATYYSELQNTVVTLPFFSLTNLPSNSYFQYRAYLSTEDGALTPQVRSIELGDGSNFGSHPGILSLDMSGATADVVIDTYLKNVTFGNQNYQIRKLRMQEGTNTPVDLTSDHVNVTQFIISNRTKTNESKNIKIDLTLSYVAPAVDRLRQRTVSLSTAVSIRRR